MDTTSTTATTATATAAAAEEEEAQQQMQQRQIMQQRRLLLEEQQDWFFNSPENASSTTTTTTTTSSEEVCKRVALDMGIESDFVYYDVAMKKAVTAAADSNNIFPPSIAPSSPGFLDAYERLLRVAVMEQLVVQKAEDIAWRKNHEAAQRAERKAKFARGPAPSTREKAPLLLPLLLLPPRAADANKKKRAPSRA